MMQQKQEPAEKKILEAAIDCIEEFGAGGATVRRIAAKAGVNVAAINYYFRTKEQMMERVVELTLQNAFGWDDLQQTDALPPAQQVFAIFSHLGEGAQRYPEITRMHFFGTAGGCRPQAERAINAFLETLLQKLVQKGCTDGTPQGETTLREALSQLFLAGVFAAGVAPGLCVPFLGGSLTENERRDAWLHGMVERLLPYGAETPVKL